MGVGEPDRKLYEVDTFFSICVSDRFVFWSCLLCLWSTLKLTRIEYPQQVARYVEGEWYRFLLQ